MVDNREIGGIGDDKDGLDFDWNDPVGSHVRDRTLVGRLVADKFINRNTIKSMIMKAWDFLKGLEIVDANDSVFYFNFERDEDCARVLSGRPWMIMGFLLVLEKWTPTLTLKELGLKLSPYWGQLHGLPLEGFNVKNILKLGDKLGKVIAVEDPLIEGRICKNFVRVKVLVDINDPFCTGIAIARPNLPRIWVETRYEKL